MMGGIIAGISIPISKTSITTHDEINFLAVVVAFTIFDFPLVGFVPLSWCSQWRRLLDFVGLEDINGFVNKG